MKENRLRESVLTDIVQLLGDKGLFTEVARAIIERAQEYLDVTNLCVIQISEEHKSLIKIAECRREEADDVLIDGMAYDKAADEGIWNKDKYYDSNIYQRRN